MNTEQVCEHDECSCEVDAASAVSLADKNYCSQRCAEGRGCDHVGCNCGAFVPEGVLGEFSPAE